jgi:hypothetical protein
MDSSWPTSSYYPGVSLEEMSKITKDLRIARPWSKIQKLNLPSTSLHLSECHFLLIYSLRSLMYHNSFLCPEEQVR